MERKFELFGGCLGNGITCCNKAVMENGDYKMVCHIGEDGEIKWRVPENYCPEDALAIIHRWAQEKKEAHEKWYNGLSEEQKLSYQLDHMTISELTEYLKERRARKTGGEEPCESQETCSPETGTTDSL